MDEVIRHHQVHSRLHVCLGTKVLMVVAAKAGVDAVVVVQHRSDTVKPGNDSRARGMRCE